MSRFCGLLIEIEYFWGQRLEGLDPVALFYSAMTSLVPVNLFDYENRKILQGVAFKDKMSSHWFVQTAMFNIQSMAIHSYIKHILRFSYILFVTFYTFNHIDHIGTIIERRAVGSLHYLRMLTSLFCDYPKPHMLMDTVGTSHLI